MRLDPRSGSSEVREGPSALWTAGWAQRLPENLTEDWRLAESQGIGGFSKMLAPSQGASQKLQLPESSRGGGEKVTKEGQRGSLKPKETCCKCLA